MQAYYYGHACLSLMEKDITLLFDPFLNHNPISPCKASDVTADYLLVSHNHSDHSGDMVEIAKKNKAQIITTIDLQYHLQDPALYFHGMNLGGSHAFPFGKVKLTPALHGSGIPGGVACGFVVQFFETTLYFAGDTALFGDMQLIGRHQLDYAFLPIGSNFTMDIDDAVEAVKLLQPKTVIPIHYNTWPLISTDPLAFQQKVEQYTESKCLILPIGKEIVL